MNYRSLSLLGLFLWLAASARAQTLINVDFGGTTNSSQVGLAAVGLATNDFWNAYSHYSPRFVPGVPAQANGRLDALRYADGTVSPVAVAVSNAPGVWGNSSGYPFFDDYIFAPNGSNITVTVTGLPAGRYQFLLYGHADADSAPEQNTVYSIRTDGPSGKSLGPLTSAGAAGWKSGQPWQEGRQYVIFRDVTVSNAEPVVIEAAPGAGGVAVLNGLQILSRGSAPPRPEIAPAVVPTSDATNLLVRAVRYQGTLRSGEARFQVELDLESPSTNTRPLTLFVGDIALIPRGMPPDWRWSVHDGQFQLHAGSAGTNLLKFDLVARVQRSEPWDSVSFTGPPASVSTIDLRSDDPDAVIQLTAGTPADSSAPRTAPGGARLLGVIAGDAKVAFRWQSRAVEVAREAVVTVETTIKTVAAPSVIRSTATYAYDVVQGRVPSLTLQIPDGVALTRLTGDGVRDWKLGTADGHPAVTVELVRPLTGRAMLNLVTEQSIARLPAKVTLAFPRPQSVQRESGVWTLIREEVSGQILGITGARQVNAAVGEWAAYRFVNDPVQLEAELSPVSPHLEVSDQVDAMVEESRVLYRHDLALKVTQAGLYDLEADLPAGWSVGSVIGEGMSDWQVQGTTLRIHLSQRLLGARALAVQLEQALGTNIQQVVLAPLRIRGASTETARITASAVAGLNLRTATLDGVREQPVGSIAQGQGGQGTQAGQAGSATDPLLAFQADAGSWQIVLATERLSTRLVAEVFNLVTIGDGLVGGSATLRYAIVNQGVQAFRVRLPHHWRNIEFTGANIRRTDHQEDLWTVALQDKAWGAYTLVLTYDHAFDPQNANLDAAGAHPLDVERETGTVAITAAPGVEVHPNPITAPLRSLDPTELAATDRAMIARPVLLAYRYEGTNFALGLQVTRHDQLTVLDAVADRTQLTSVLTEQGEMLTQATFLVKNNERQYQRFQLPPDAALWGVAVNGEPAKADRDGDWVLVNLPTAADRDQVFAVDLNYAQQFGHLSRAGGLLARPIALTAPQTDVPGTYAQWELYTPTDRYVGHFGGNMNRPPGSQYGVRDAVSEFARAYKSLIINYWIGFLIFGLMAAWFIASRWRGGRMGITLIELLVIVGIVAILLGMMLPALSSAKAKGQRISSVNNLKQIGLAARIFETDHGRMPYSPDEMMTELGSDKNLYHPGTGEAYTWIGCSDTNAPPETVIAYGPEYNNGREVLFYDGSVRMLSAAQFNEMAPDASSSRLLSSSMGRRYAMASKNVEEIGLQSPPPSMSVVPQPQGQELPKSAAGYDANAVKSPVAALGVTRSLEKAAPTAGGFGGGAFKSAQIANGVTTLGKPALPTAAGLRSLKIEIPKTGRVLSFTRVLNLNGEPARLEFSILSARIQSVRESLFQLVTFLVGLIWARSEWRSTHAKGWRLATAVALTLVGLVSLFVSFQILGIVLILLPPLGLLIAIVAFVSKRRSSKTRADSGPDAPPSPPPITPDASQPPVIPASPAAAAVAILFAIGLGLGAPSTLSAADSISLASILQSNLNGQAGDLSAQLEATLELSSAGTNQVVELLGPDAAVQEFAVTSGEARLLREGGKASVLLSHPGRAGIRLRWLVNVGGDPSRRTLESSLPVAVGTHLHLSIAEADVAIDFPSALAFTRTNAAQQTQIDAVLGATNHLTLAWSPRVGRISAPPTALLATQASLATIGNGVATVRTVIDFSAPQGEAQSLQIVVPTAQRLVRVSGDLVRTWDFSPTNRSEVIIELTKPSATARIEIETEQSVESLPAPVTLTVPTPKSVRRVTGWIALRAGDEIGLTLQRNDGLERVEAAALTPLLGAELGPIASTWRFLEPGFNLQLRAELLTPRVEATLNHQFTVGFDQVTASLHADFAVSRVGVFSLRFALPESIRIDRVDSPAMASFAEHRTATGRELELTLKQRTVGEIAVDIGFSRSLTNLPPQLNLVGLTPVGVARVAGFVSAAAEPGINLKSIAFPGLAEIPANTLPNGGTATTGWLAFKRLPTDAGSSEWSLTLATETVDSWVRAETATFVTVGESFASGRATVRYDIQNAPVKEFVLRVPAAWKNVEITGPGIRRRDQTNRSTGIEWRIELQNKARGDFRLQVKWEQPRDATNQFSVSGLEVLGAERETGSIAFYTRGQVQLIAPTTTNSLLRIDARELPDWAPAPSRDPARLSYRYLRPGWQLSFEVRQYQDAALLQALIERARLRTVVADDGQMMSQMQLQIRNNGRQSLELTLPSDAEVWSAFVNNEPVRPARRDQQILIPLEGTDSAGASVDIELTYVIRGSFPKGRGTVELASPQLDVPLKDAQWELFLPPDYDYSHFGGSMNLQTDDINREARDYTLASYNWQQTQQAAARKAAESELLNETRRGLSDNNLQTIGKLERFSRLSAAGNDGREDLAYKDLKEAVNAAQSSNLIEAQQDYAYSNNDRLSQDKRSKSFAYDTSVAKQQVAQLNRAQAVVTTHVSPLHVNLPTRGLRFNFSQVLQTQPGEALTVTFRARNERNPGAVRSVIGGAVVLLVLWATSVLILAFRPEPKNQPLRAQ